MATGLVMALLNGVHVQAAGRPLVQQFLVGKGIHHMQNGAGTPELGTNKPYQFMANLEPTAPPILIRHVYLMLSTGGGFEIDRKSVV